MIKGAIFIVVWTFLIASAISFKIAIPVTVSGGHANDVVFEYDMSDDLWFSVSSFFEEHLLEKSNLPNFMNVVIDIVSNTKKSMSEKNSFDYTRPLVNSFDIFDTILARDVFPPEQIYDLVEQLTSYPNYKALRTQAASLHTTSSFEGIYRIMEHIEGLPSGSLEYLKEIEISMEMNHSYIIMQNYNRVRDGDILISDMYLSDKIISGMLSNAGYKRLTNVYVSDGGKYWGWMWKYITSIYDIGLHVGDNAATDVYMALNHKVKAEHTIIHELTETEQFLRSQGSSGTQLAMLLRKFRHQNPYEIASRKARLFEEQAQYNIPQLHFFAHKLRRIMIEEKLTRLLLTARDGACIMEKIFRFLYPEIECLRFETSRKMYREKPEEFRKYLREMYIPKKTLLFDTGGSFKNDGSIFIEEFGELPRLHLGNAVSNIFPFDSKTFSIENYKINAETNCVGLKLEILNRDVVGSLINVYKNETGSRVFVRGPLNEYSIEDVKVSHETVDFFVSSQNSNIIVNLLDDLHNQGILDNITETFPLLWPPSFTTPDIYVPDETDLKNLTMKEPWKLGSFSKAIENEFAAFLKPRDSYKILYIEDFSNLQTQASTIIPWVLKTYFGPSANISGAFEHLDSSVVITEDTNEFRYYQTFFQLNQLFQYQYDIIIESTMCWRAFLRRFNYIQKQLKNGGIRFIHFQSSLLQVTTSVSLNSLVEKYLKLNLFESYNIRCCDNKSSSQFCGRTEKLTIKSIVSTLLASRNEANSDVLCVLQWGMSL